MLRGYCFHSLPTDPPLEVFACFSLSTGDVFTAQCNCVSGLGAACNHIAALLFALEDCVKRQMEELPVTLSKTSIPMTWNQPSKKLVSPSVVSDLTFTKPVHGKSAVNSVKRSSRQEFDPRAKGDGEINMDELMVFQADMELAFPESGLFQFWKDRSLAPHHTGEKLTPAPDFSSLIWYDIYHELSPCI